VSGWKQAMPAACTLLSYSNTFIFKDYFKKLAIYLMT